MKKIFYTVILVSAIGITTLQFSACSNTQGNTAQTFSGIEIPDLIDRDIAAGSETEYEELHTRFDNAILVLEKHPDDIKQFLTIASVYIAEARITGNGAYYNDAALRMLNHVIDQSMGNNDNLYLAMSMKSGVLLSLHQFGMALNTAQNALALNNHNATVYGALTDANVELGNYNEAVKACDAMLSLKPDIRSYARASYIRQIYGDNAGAIDAMKMAVTAGVAGMENTEWARVTLGDIYFTMGKLDIAKQIYNTSLQYRADYTPALAGLAKVAMTEGDYKQSIDLLEQAITIRSESHYVSMLAEAYQLSGNTKKAKEINEDVLELLLDGEKEQKNYVVKHHSARELAQAYFAANDLKNAMKYALQDLEMRPNNIDANALAAWISYKSGDMQTAKMYADKMLVTGIQNSDYLYKASLIYNSNGDVANAEKYAESASNISPYYNKVFSSI
ncbi:MAG: tetratricopeptide repeat protein [Chitinophagales bacterium]|nr:tetratricopeptide repeat protein [Bacteroidota bacterium]MBP7400622.1 tetratricopeptide repeat protein [Chitinophagales bacterium]MBP8754491.1 tetratricopeptide repeat protein [Chitinophagales bacterium]MBP9190070.1 tetratricopeptide repeat protein [Chitinophagales bacterium]MBP9549370.1 tetratricopeptide repeat protein [Chitinophagales bacterium]